MRDAIMGQSVSATKVEITTAAAMMTGFFSQSEQVYAWLQVSGALATLAVLTLTAHVALSLKTLGVTAYGLICAGAVLTGLGAHPLIYAAGFLLIAGFDKMFNIYVRTLRKEIIPPEEFGKTTGVIICLNNLSQPLAGLIVAIFARPGVFDIAPPFGQCRRGGGSLARNGRRRHRGAAGGHPRCV